MSRSVWLGALAAVALLASVAAHAGGEPAHDGPACLPVAGGGVLSVEGVGRVVFEELATDRVRDAATFGGQVCLAVEGSDVVFRTERLDVAGFAGPLALEANGVQVEVPGWTLEAEVLRGGPGWAELAQVTIVGADAVGLADAMRLEFDSGVLVASRLRLMTPALRLDAATATLDGDTLVAEGARVSTCECPLDETPLRIDAERVRLDVAGASSALVEGGTVVVGGVRWPLAQVLALDAASLAALALPLAIGPDPDRDGAWRVALLEREVAPGMRASAAWTGATADAPARGGVALEGAAGDVAFSWIGASDRVSFDLRAVAPLGGGWRAVASQRFEAGAIEEPYRDATVRLAHAASTTGTWGRASVELGARTALTGQTLATGDVAGPRLGVDARAGWTGPAAPVAPALEVAFAATTYPGLDAQQIWASVRPGLTVRAGGVRVDATHLARWVQGGSPFSARVDRAVPEQRSDVLARWRGTLPAGAGLEMSVAFRYRWGPDAARPGRPIGVEDLTVRAQLSVPTGEATVGVDLDLALAGRVDPRTDRDAFAALRLRYVRERVEFGVRTTLGLEPGGAWRDLTLFAAVPFEPSPAWSWRPYLAIDVLAFAGGEGPWLRGHGLEVAWRTCCGTVELGYRSDAVDGATTHFALVLPMRPLDPTRLAAVPNAR